MPEAETHEGEPQPEDPPVEETVADQEWTEKAAPAEPSEPEADGPIEDTAEPLDWLEEGDVADRP